MDQMCIVSRNDLQTVLFVCHRCGFDPNMIVEFTSSTHHYIASVPNHISIRNLLVYYLDIHYPMSSYMFKILSTRISEEMQENVAKLMDEGPVNVVEVMKAFPELVISLEVLSEMLPIVQYIPMRIASSPAENGFISITHDCNRQSEKLRNQLSYVNSLMTNSKLRFFFQTSPVNIPTQSDTDVVLVADSRGVHTVLSILEYIKNIDPEYTCNIYLFLETNTDPDVEDFQNVVVHRASDIRKLMKEHSDLIRTSFELLDSWFYINSSSENSRDIHNEFLKILSGTTDPENLNILEFRRTICKVEKMLEQKRLHHYTF